MPIDSQHPLYKAKIVQWQRCRDAYEGEDAVKEAGTKYLPKLGAQESLDYQAYKLRALYYGAVARTVDGFVGAIARKPMQVDAPESMAEMLENITGDGVNALEYVKSLCAESILMGRCGILVDFDDDADSCVLVTYQAESIINWGPDSIVLSETVYESPDGMEQVEVEQIRQLHLVDGAYTSTVWRKQGGNTIDADNWIIHSVTVPSMRGAALAEIPFLWLSAMGGTAKVDKPPLLGLVDVCLSHYRNSADLEHGRHFTGLPTLWIAGERTNPDDPIRVGSMAAILLADANAKVGYAEFTGQGLQSLENALQEKEHMMAVLGAATFSSGKKGVEAAETAQIRTAGENSLLMGVVSAVEQVFTKAMLLAAQWMGIAGDITVQINRDFVDVRMDPNELQQLVGAYQAGAITLDTLLYNVQQAEMLDPGRTIEDEMAALKAAKPQVVTVLQPLGESPGTNSGGA